MPIWFTPGLTLEMFRAQSRMRAMADHLEIELIELGDDFLRGRMPVNEKTRQPYGVLHGGASAALAETLGSIGGTLCIDTSRLMAVGIEINANHIRPVVAPSTVIGTARPLHIGASTHVWDIRIENEAGKLVCASRLTLAIVPVRSKELRVKS